MYGMAQTIGGSQPAVAVSAKPLFVENCVE
jgi:hypothetical protein